jgi:hypothetical protein
VKLLKPQKSETVSAPDSLAELGTIRLMAAVKKYGLSRTLLFELCIRKRINSFLIKKHSNSRGVRLIDEADLIRYIREEGGAA